MPEHLLDLRFRDDEQLTDGLLEKIHDKNKGRRKGAVLQFIRQW